jgi:hypothetical protein
VPPLAGLAEWNLACIDSGVGDGMNPAFRAVSIVAVCGAALLAAMPVAGGTAAAADLPIKAPPKTPDTAGQF